MREQHNFSKIDARGNPYNIRRVQPVTNIHRPVVAAPSFAQNPSQKLPPAPKFKPPTNQPPQIQFKKYSATVTAQHLPKPQNPAAGHVPTWRRLPQPANASSPPAPAIKSVDEIVEKIPFLKRYSRMQFAMLSAACLIFILGLSVSILGFKTNKQVQAQAQKLTQNQNSGSEDAGDHPDETDPGPKAVGKYSVAPDMPKRISIPKLKINARIKTLGTKSNNELKAPSNIYDTGWYERSAKPGSNGAMLIDGHVHGLTKPGVFYNLKKLSAGDMIEIERGDGKMFRYKVVKTEVYDRQNTDMSAALTSIDPGRPGLNIITCTGALEKENNTYEDRLLVSAVLVD